MRMHNSTRIDVGYECWTILAIKLKAPTVEGGGGGRPLCDPGFELRNGGSWTSRANIGWDGEKSYETPAECAPTTKYGVIIYIYHYRARIGRSKRRHDKSKRLEAGPNASLRRGDRVYNR